MKKHTKILIYTLIYSVIIILSIIISDTETFIIPSKLNITVIQNTVYEKNDYQQIKKYYHKCSQEDLCINRDLKDSEKEEIYQILKTSGHLYQSKQIIRNINSPAKKILNGYLGSLFRFKLLGNILWLIIPLILIFFIKKNYTRIKKEEKQALFFILTIYLVYFIIITPYGHNYRYQLTLTPLNLFLVTYFIQKVFNTKKEYLLFLISIMMFNLFFFYITPLVNQSDKNNKNELTQAINQNKKNPYEFIKKHQGIYLVNNTPEFYYHTNETGYFYWSGSDEYTTKKGSLKLMANHDLKEIKDILKNKLKCTYIFTKSEFKLNNGKFRKFLEEETKLIYQDNSYEIYKL